MLSESKENAIESGIGPKVVKSGKRWAVTSREERALCLEEHEMRLRALGLAADELKRAMDPLRSFFLVREEVEREDHTS